MIRFSLRCDQAHEFESWFPSGAAYDEQTRRGLVTCPLCNSARVSKAIMAPNVARADREAEAAPVVGGEQHVALADDNLRKLHAMIRELRAKILEQTTDVGAAFPEEARKIQAGEAAERPIRGQASLEEARALLEDGIEIMPIPPAPEERN